MHSENRQLARLMNMAQRELSAFMIAVTEAYGSEEGKLAADDWLNELVARDELPDLTIRDWRRITIAAAAQLANRLNGRRMTQPHETVRCMPIDVESGAWVVGRHH